MFVTLEPVPVLAAKALRIEDLVLNKEASKTCLLSSSLCETSSLTFGGGGGMLLAKCEVAYICLTVS